MPSGPVRRPPHELAFAAAIKAARVEAGRTQIEVAEAAGLPLHTLQSAEQGARRTSVGEWNVIPHCETVRAARNRR
jgi:DNA-binding XRE family transcriptional regulator